MNNKISITEVIRELESSSKLTWEREEEDICVDTETANYHITICKHNNIEKITYFINSSTDYLEGYCDPQKDVSIYNSLLSIYLIGYPKAAIVKAAS